MRSPFFRCFVFLFFVFCSYPKLVLYSIDIRNSTFRADEIVLIKGFTLIKLMSFLVRFVIYFIILSASAIALFFFFSFFIISPEKNVFVREPNNLIAFNYENKLKIDKNNNRQAKYETKIKGKSLRQGLLKFKCY